MNDVRGDELAALRAARRVDDAELATVTDRHALDALREGITMTDRNTAPTVEAPRRGRRLGRRGMAAGALALVLAGGGAAAYSVARQDNGPTLDGVNCADSVTIDGDGTVHLTGSADGRVTSGDDVADCAQVRADAGMTALVDPYAFTLGGTHYVVSRRGVPADVLAKGQASAPDPQQSAVLELQSAMADWVEGPAYTCYTADQATAYARRTLAAVGLEGWTTRVVDAAGQQGSGPCASIEPLPDTRVVEVRAHAHQEPTEDPQDVAHVVYEVAGGLRKQVAGKCLSLAEARTVAREVVGTNGEIVAVPDEKASCTRVDMEVGGTIFVTLRGPSVTKP